MVPYVPPTGNGPVYSCPLVDKCGYRGEYAWSTISRHISTRHPPLKASKRYTAIMSDNEYKVCLPLLFCTVDATIYTTQYRTRTSSSYQWFVVWQAYKAALNVARVARHREKRKEHTEYWAPIRRNVFGGPHSKLYLSCSLVVGAGEGVFTLEECFPGDIVTMYSGLVVSTTEPRKLGKLLDYTQHLYGNNYLVGNQTLPRAWRGVWLQSQQWQASPQSQCRDSLL